MSGFLQLGKFVAFEIVGALCRAGTESALARFPAGKRVKNDETHNDTFNKTENQMNAKKEGRLGRPRKVNGTPDRRFKVNR